jgi:hypothetical protein
LKANLIYIGICIYDIAKKSNILELEDHDEIGSGCWMINNFGKFISHNSKSDHKKYNEF